MDYLIALDAMHEGYGDAQAERQGALGMCLGGAAIMTPLVIAAAFVVLFGAAAILDKVFG